MKTVPTLKRLHHTKKVLTQPTGRICHDLDCVFQELCTFPAEYHAIFFFFFFFFFIEKYHYIWSLQVLVTGQLCTSLTRYYFSSTVIIYSVFHKAIKKKNYLQAWQKGPNKLNKCSSHMQCLPIFCYATSPSKTNCRKWKCNGGKYRQWSVCLGIVSL